MSEVVFSNANIFDGVSDALRRGVNVLVDGNRIAKVTEGPIASGGERIDCTGKTLMPGLIDCHVHVYAADLDLTTVGKPLTYYAQYAGRFFENALDMGFTTLRDVAGGDHGLAMAIASGFIEAPRYFYGGLALSQTGGHGDMRPPTIGSDFCNCGAEATYLSILADGVDECVKAVREELRKGAHHIKIMGSGGVLSPSDPLHRCQYSDAEISAIVDECTRQGAYVAAHCHPDEAIRRCAELGVRTIEHATLITRSTAELLVSREAFAVPTFAVISALKESGKEMGIPQVSMDKLMQVYDYAQEGLRIMDEAGVKVALGTDLLAEQHVLECTEFTLRAEVQSNASILRSATSVGAELLRMEDSLGQVKAGFLADLILVERDPLTDISVLASGGKDVSLVMRDGEVVRRGY